MTHLTSICVADMPKLKKPSAPRYDKRIILFIDFLGFKEVVERTKTDVDEFSRLIDALESIGVAGELTTNASQQVTQFSDSLVISYKVSETSGVFWMVNAIALTLIQLVGQGYLLRGAVTIGKLYHTQRHLVGPAMLTAYEMESKVACVPRVIFDPKIIKAARRHPQPGHTPDEEESYVRHFVKTDLDGQLYLDFVTWKSVVEVAGLDSDAYPEYLAKLATLIETGLNHEDVRVIEKYLWLHRAYAAERERFAAMPAQYVHDPEYVDAITALPSFSVLATKARKRLGAAKNS
ncbi:MAG: hypothetical protein ACT6R2_14045 [Blastomonas fulva]|jgi:hypothetical protein|uniref:hypothetical protein n=2 Tax=Pseudomonadota TaxID=1224 RepID=UPI0006B8EFD1|nr:hypothetical protein [Blastomonas sp.]MCO5795189.1 hypothetical protein [Blastomonas sp.]